MKRRKGFTLVELLVVIAIIGILVALLLPAIQAARAAARRMTCKSHLRNIALALHNYASSYKRFPPGFHFDLSGTVAIDRASWSWTTAVLPYLEQQALYDALGVSDRTLAKLFQSAGGKGASLTSPEIALLRQPLAVYRCPSDLFPDQLPRALSGVQSYYPEVTSGSARHFDSDYSPTGFEPSTSNYMAVKGLYDNDWTYNIRENGGNNGVMYMESKIAFKDITDGTSNTFLLGERNGRCLAGTWIGCRNPPGPDMWGSYYCLGRTSIKLNYPTSGAHNTCTEGFSSDHVGGAHFAMADASVRFIENSISCNNGGISDRHWDPKNPDNYYPNQLGIYQRLSIRNDGMTIDP
ncbi:MAG: DUF1559 domain-containing protein [Pirellulales bacterium]|nr:DUF1559 domain-containing protein [Pirellulales bacterium]